MNDEIKEILESSRKIIKSNRENGFDRIIMLGDDIDKLLDYITNLQEENQRLKKENTKLYKKDTKIINELKEELKITQEKWNKDKQWSECRTKEWLDYKSRCEKTIEYIDKWKFEVAGNGACMDYEDIQDLLQILGGGEE